MKTLIHNLLLKLLALTETKSVTVVAERAKSRRGARFSPEVKAKMAAAARARWADPAVRAQMLAKMAAARAAKE